MRRKSLESQMWLTQRLRYRGRRAIRQLLIVPTCATEIFRMDPPVIQCATTTYLCWVNTTQVHTVYWNSLLDVLTSSTLPLIVSTEVRLPMLFHKRQVLYIFQYSMTGNSLQHGDLVDYSSRAWSLWGITKYFLLDFNFKMLPLNTLGRPQYFC